MAKNNLFLGFRKMRLSLCLNILGLTVAFTAFMVIMVQVDYDLGFDNFYKNKDRTFRVEYSFPYAEGDYSAVLSRPLSGQLAESSPDIELWANWSTMWGMGAEVKAAENNDIAIYAEQALFSYENLELFEFELIEGNRESFAEPGKALLPSQHAVKLFPEGNAVGQLISIDDTNYEIAGIYKEFPSNSSVKNYIFFNLGNMDIDNSSEWSYPMYVRLNDATNKAKAESAMNELILNIYKDDFEFEPGTGIIRLSSLNDIYYAKDIRYDIVDKGNKAMTFSLISIAIFILIIAIINFINFALASVPSMIKSINTRKILGSTNGALRRGQITESVILALISFGLAILIFDLLKGTRISDYISGPLNISENIDIILHTAVAAILTGIIAGIYPAFYSTSYQPALVLKGSFSLSPGGRKLRAFLIGFQFTISLILIIVALYIKEQSGYMKKFDMGFRTENIVNFRISEPVAQQKTGYVNRLREAPFITDVTFADGPLVSRGKMGWGRTYKGERVNFDCMPVDPNFIDFFNLELLEGRDFEESDLHKINGTFIFNETAVKKYNFIIGDKLAGHHNEPADIVGIVKDFNFQPLQYGIEPICLYVMGSQPWRLQTYAYVKIAPGHTRQALEHIKTVSTGFDPGLTDISYIFMDEGVNRLYAREDALASLILIFCYLSVFISIMGVMGLIFFETRFRKKEIALRRIMGANISELLIMLNTIYVKITLISFVIATPIAWIICRTWVKSFRYQSPVPVWIFLTALLTVLVINIIIITARSYKTVTGNPAKSITNE